MAGLIGLSLLLGIGSTILSEFAGGKTTALACVAATVVVLAASRPVWALTLVFLAAALGNMVLPGVPMGLQLIHGLCVLGLAAVAFGVVNGAATDRLARPEVRLPLVFASILVLAAIISTGISISPGYSVKHTLTLTGGLLLAAAIIGVGRTWRRLRLFVAAATVGSLAVTIPALLNAGQMVSLYGGSVVQNRAIGSFTDPNTFGSFCMIIVFLGMSWLITASQSWERFVAFVGVVAAMGALTMSLSRGAWLGTVLGGVVLVLLDRRARKLVASFALVGAGGFILALLLLPGGGVASIAVDRALSSSDQSTNPYDVRPITWREALREFDNAPVFGNGPGSFSVLSASSDSELQFYPRRHAHNGFLTFAAETGAVGAVAFIGLAASLTLAIRNRSRRLRAARRWPESGILAGAAAALAGIFGHLLVDYPFRNPVMMIMVWAVIGVALAVIAMPIPGTFRAVGFASPTRSKPGAPAPGPRPSAPPTRPSSADAVGDRTMVHPLLHRFRSTAPLSAPVSSAPAGPGRPGDEGDVQLRKLARSGGWSFIGAIVNAVLSFAVVVLVSRGLGAEGAGVFAFAVAIFMTLSVAGRLGTDTGLVRILPPLRSAHDDERIVETIRAALVPICVVLTVVAAIMWWLAPTLAPWLLPDIPTTEASQLLRVVAALLPLGTASFVALAATRGLGSIKPMVIVENIVKPTARCAFVGGVLLVGAGIFGVTVAWAIGTVVGIVISVFSLKRAVARVVAADAATPDPTHPDFATHDRSAWRELWSFSAPRGLSAICEIAGLHIGIVLVSSLSGSADAGVFNAVLRLVLAGTLAMQALRLATAPQVSQLLNRGNARQVQRLHQASTGWVIALSWPPYLVMAVWPEHVLSLFGSEFPTGAASLTVLALATLINFYTGNVATVLLMSGGSTASLVVTIASLIVQITLCAALAPTMGVMGAAIAKGVSIIGENIALVLLVREKLGVRTICAGTLVASAAAVACFGVPALALRLAGASPTGTSGLITASVGVAVGLLVYSLALFRLRNLLQLKALGAVIRRKRTPKSKAVSPKKALKETHV